MLNETLYFLLLLIRFPGTAPFTVSSLLHEIQNNLLGNRVRHSSQHGHRLSLQIVLVKRYYSENQNKRKRCI